MVTLPGTRDGLRQVLSPSMMIGFSAIGGLDDRQSSSQITVLDPDLAMLPGQGEITLPPIPPCSGDRKDVDDACRALLGASPTSPNGYRPYNRGENSGQLLVTGRGWRVIELRHDFLVAGCSSNIVLLPDSRIADVAERLLLVGRASSRIARRNSADGRERSGYRCRRPTRPFDPQPTIDRRPDDRFGKGRYRRRSGGNGLSWLFGEQTGRR